MINFKWKRNSIIKVSPEHICLRVGLVSERCVWLSLGESGRIPGWGCGLSGSSDLLQAEWEALLWGEVFLPPRPNSLQFSRSWGWSQRPSVKRQMLSGQKNLLNSCQLVTNYYLKSFSPNSHLASLRCPRKTWKDRRVRSLVFSPFPDMLSPADPQSCPTNTPVSSPNLSAFPVPRAGGLLAAFSGTWLHALGSLSKFLPLHPGKLTAAFVALCRSSTT